MNSSTYYKNKIILITGAASGIGKALAEEILKYFPQKLILADINEKALEMFRESISNHHIETYTCDVSSEIEMKQLFNSTIKNYSRIDIVFNNAGIASGGEFQNYSFDHWKKMIDINLWGIIYGSTFAYKQMIRQNSGHIVNVASLGGLIPEPMASVYSTTKHGVVGLSTTLREEAKAYGVNVSVVCPGVINTPIFDTATFAGNVDPEKVKKATLEHGAISAIECAKKILKKVSSNKGIITVKKMDKIFWLTYRFSPKLLSVMNQYIAKYFRENFQKNLQHN